MIEENLDEKTVRLINGMIDAVLEEIKKPQSETGGNELDLWDIFISLRTSYKILRLLAIAHAEPEIQIEQVQILMKKEMEFGISDYTESLYPPEMSRIHKQIRRLRGEHDEQEWV